MAQRTLPSPNVPIGTGRCAKCGADVEVKITSTWFQELLKLVKQVNDNASS